ncbi:MAG TPA: YcnI family protein [Solirubrobacteraceae bacterium]|nr:YcnI family protein [Solirubrobacteraceae bacterium]
MQRKTIAAAVAATCLAVPSAAAAHVTVSPEQIPAEGYSFVDVNVPHGCEESPTTSITVQLPDSVVGATPEVATGWTIKVKEGKLPKPIEQHGETITEGPREVTWSGGNLDAHQLQRFGMSIQTAGTAGESAYFKILQKCKEGETAWAEIPVEGEEEPEAPAATVQLIAAGDAHGAAASGDDAAATEEVSAQNASAQSAGVSADDLDGKASTGLAIAGIVMGAIGLLAAGFAVATSRRKA